MVNETPAKILIVDDSESLRTQLRRDLEAGGYCVVEADNGASGLEMLKKSADVSLFICDVNMPRMDGYEFSSRVRELSDFRRTPLFMLTTEASVEMKERGRSIGITAWIVKPYAAPKLLAAIKKVLSASLQNAA